MSQIHEQQQPSSNKPASPRPPTISGSLTDQQCELAMALPFSVIDFDVMDALPEFNDFDLVLAGQPANAACSDAMAPGKIAARPCSTDGVGEPSSAVGGPAALEVCTSVS
jgi:hypothetical protein